MEGTPRPSHNTSLIFSHEWPINDTLRGQLEDASEHGFIDWVVIPLPTMTWEALRDQAETLSMRVQGLFDL